MPDNHSEEFRKLPQGSEAFGSVPNPSESFGKVPNDSESFRTVPNPMERRENHTLTVREVARMFESAGVARTERSIVNWCQQNKMGISRLDCYFDPNERKYFITSQSVEMAISEEKGKAARTPLEPPEERPSVRDPRVEPESDGEVDREGARSVRQLRRELSDLKITNQVKDQFIEQLKVERQDLFREAMEKSRTIGQLETKLLQLEGPKIPSDSVQATSNPT